MEKAKAIDNREKRISLLGEMLDNHLFFMNKIANGICAIILSFVRVAFGCATSFNQGVFNT